MGFAIGKGAGFPARLFTRLEKARKEAVEYSQKDLSDNFYQEYQGLFDELNYRRHLILHFFKLALPTSYHNSDRLRGLLSGSEGLFDKITLLAELSQAEVGIRPSFEGNQKWFGNTGESPYSELANEAKYQKALQTYVNANGPYQDNSSMRCLLSDCDLKRETVFSRSQALREVLSRIFENNPEPEADLMVQTTLDNLQLYIDANIPLATYNESTNTEYERDPEIYTWM